MTKKMNMKHTRMAFGLIAMMLPASATFAADPPENPPQHDIQTGDDLSRVCANPAGGAATPAERARLEVCGAYIRGYLGYYSVSRNLTQGKGFCLPQGGIAVEKLRLLYIGVLAKKPEIRDYPAAVDLASILQAAYPCQSAPAKMP